MHIAFQSCEMPGTQTHRTCGYIYPWLNFEAVTSVLLLRCCCCCYSQLHCHCCCRCRSIAAPHISFEMDLLNSMDLKHFSMHIFCRVRSIYASQTGALPVYIECLLSRYVFVHSSLLFLLQFILFPWILILLRIPIV